MQPVLSPERSLIRIADPKLNYRKKDETYHPDVIAEGRRMLRKVEQAFGLPYQGLYLRWKGSGRPVKVYGTTNLSELRNVLAVVLREKLGDYPDRVFAMILGIDRTTFINTREVAEIRMEVQDEIFLLYYERVNEILSVKEVPLWISEPLRNVYVA